MLATILPMLLDGAYICPVRYPQEFAALTEQPTQDAAEAWLATINMRLARLGEEGAFFMAPAFIGSRQVAQIRDEILRFRDVYFPAAQMLDLIRQTDPSTVQLVPGEYVALYDLDRALAQSTTLEVQLRGVLGVIRNGSARQSNHENLRALLEHLAKDGYLVLANKDSGTYQVTGKIEQLFAVVQYLDEHKLLPNAEIDDRGQSGQTQELL